MKNKYLTYRCIVIILIWVGIAVCVRAETIEDRELMKHELRIGWGDQMFESLIWHNPTHIVTTMPQTYQQTYHEDYRYTQHIWLEYQNRYNRWFSYGGMVDASAVLWTDVVRNGCGEEVLRDPGHNFYNIIIMPTIRFTYWNHPYVNLYSELGFGLDINGGTERNFIGQLTDVGAAINIILIGVSANYERWFWTVDLGGLYSLRDVDTIFLASSKIISVGLGVRF